MEHFSIHSRSGNLYLMLDYNCDCNVILVEPFCSKNYRHCLATCNNTRTKIKQRGHDVNLQVLDNKTST